MASVSVSTSPLPVLNPHDVAWRRVAGREDLLGEADRVTADVGQGAAAELGREADVHGPRQEEVERAHELADLADGPRGQEREQATVLVVEGEDEGLPQQRPCGGGGLEHLEGLGRADTERLLAKDGLSGLESPSGPARRGATFGRAT